MDLLHFILRKFKSLHRGFQALSAKLGKGTFCQSDFLKVLAEENFEASIGLYASLVCGKKAVSKKEWSLLENFQHEAQKQAGTSSSTNGEEVQIGLDPTENTTGSCSLCVRARGACCWRLSFCVF